MAERVEVVVAVKSVEGRGSQRAVRWTVENFMPENDCLVLVHVMPPIVSVPTPSGGTISFKGLDPSVAELYIHDMRKQFEENFVAFKHQYRKVKIRIVLLEGEDVASVLLKYIHYSRSKSFVLGSSSHHFSRKSRDSSVPSVVLKHAPDACGVYVISGHKLSSLNSVSSRAESEPDSGLSRSSTADSSYEFGRSNSQEQTSMSSFASSSETIRKMDCPVSSKNQLLLALRSRQSESISTSQSEQLGAVAEMDRLQRELVTTLTMYNRACDELVEAQSKVHSVSSECIQESQKVQAAERREEKSRKNAAEANQKYLEARKELERAKELLDKEINERHLAELRAENESLEKVKIVDALLSSDQRYRRYTRDDIMMATDSLAEDKMIGEGAYGKVYKGSLDHTVVAIKVLQSDAYESKKKEFLKEVEVLSQLRHPHIVCLLGACPEMGGLVYEYMENGSLEDHLFRRRGKPPMPWHARFRIAFEIACGLAFLHHSKPDPIVHRDLKPGNILLDRYYGSKIGDVGLAKLISDVAPDNITEYKDSVVAGTWFYMDPEYHRTGTLRPKSDLYSFGVLTLQLLAARHPNGLILEFENTINRGSFLDAVDRSVADWPLPETGELLRMALRCCQLRCRDRPDLETEVLPVLKKLATFADSFSSRNENARQIPKQFLCPIIQEVMEDPHIAADGFSYEHEAIQMWLQMHDVSPVTKMKMPHKGLTPNLALHSAIQEWRKCKSPVTSCVIEKLCS